MQRCLTSFWGSIYKDAEPATWLGKHLLKSWLFFSPTSFPPWRASHNSPPSWRLRLWPAPAHHSSRSAKCPLILLASRQLHLPQVLRSRTNSLVKQVCVRLPKVLTTMPATSASTRPPTCSFGFSRLERTRQRSHW